MVTLRRVLTVLVAAGLAGCDSDRFAHLEGTYDLTATLETYSYGIPGTKPGVDCPANNVHCSATEGAKGATLSGTMVFGSGGDESDFGETVFPARATVVGSWCAGVDAQNGCTGLTPVSLTYNQSLMMATDFGIRGRVEQGPLTGSVMGIVSGPMAGDSLTGTITWIQPVASLADEFPAYRGRFVARKRNPLRAKGWVR